jgi:hypothetical protein
LTEGIQVQGMSPLRQIGLMLFRNRLGLNKDGFDFGYALAVTNGRTDTLALNDNNKPALFGRLMFYFSRWFNLNLAGFIDDRTVGQLPNLFDEDVKGAEVSLVLNFDALRIEAQGLYQHTTFPTTGASSVNTVGTHAQWSYRLWDFELGYRFALYNPSDLFNDDQVIEHTIGLNYYFPKVPVRAAVDGTITQNQISLSNNRVVFLVQYLFGQQPSPYDVTETGTGRR